jgi:hypothetical protein
LSAPRKPRRARNANPSREKVSHKNGKIQCVMPPFIGFDGEGAARIPKSAVRR